MNYPGDSYELYHHGIFGQRWGKRNGPPYPLSRSQKSRKEKKGEEREPLTDKEKEKIIKSGSAQQINQVKDQLTNQELQTAMDRINLYRKLSTITSSETKSGFDTVNDIMKKVGNVNNWAETGIKSYRLINEILNELEKAGVFKKEKK